MDIRTDGDRVLHTELLPENWEPVFCSRCGGRLGWCDNEFSGADESVLVCDNCAVDVTEE